MSITVEKNLLKMTGVINEQTSSSQIAMALREASAMGSRVVVDMSGVSRCNSIGIWGWLRSISDSGNPPITYVNCPPWLIDQFNMLREFLVGDVVVESIQVPFYNESTDEIVLQVLKIGEDLPVCSSYENYEVPAPQSDQGSYELAVDPENYFAFLTRHPSAS